MDKEKKEEVIDRSVAKDIYDGNRGIDTSAKATVIETWSSPTLDGKTGTSRTVVQPRNTRWELRNVCKATIATIL